MPQRTGKTLLVRITANKNALLFQILVLDSSDYFLTKTIGISLQNSTL